MRVNLKSVRLRRDSVTRRLCILPEVLLPSIFFSANDERIYKIYSNERVCSAPLNFDSLPTCVSEILGSDGHLQGRVG